MSQLPDQLHAESFMFYICREARRHERDLNRIRKDILILKERYGIPEPVITDADLEWIEVERPEWNEFISLAH